MNQRAVLSLVLLGVAFAVGTVVASGWGSDAPRRPPPDVEPSAPQGPSLAASASPEELKLWNGRSCLTCHGADAHGTLMGPDLFRVLPLYLAKHGSADAAAKALAAYIVDPKNSPKLRDDGAKFINPMPAIERIGGKRTEADALARMLLRLVE